MKAIKLTALFVLLSGCATSGEFNAAGVKPFVQDAASRSWIYAQLSSNAYGTVEDRQAGQAGQAASAQLHPSHDAPEFKLAGLEKDCSIKLDEEIPTTDCSLQFKSGFKAVVYKVSAGEHNDRAVIAYAGTDPDSIRHTAKGDGVDHP